jgi:hypothetical protein
MRRRLDDRDKSDQGEAEDDGIHILLEKDIWMNVKYLSSEAKKEGMASLRVSSSLYARGHTAFRHRHATSYQNTGEGEDPTKQESHGFD